MCDRYIILLKFISAGDDAVKYESLPDDVIIAKAMAVLRSIFGDETVPQVRTIIIRGYPLSLFFSLKKLMSLVGEEMSMPEAHIHMWHLVQVEMITIFWQLLLVPQEQAI